jgi:hypothetical protein
MQQQLCSTPYFQAIYHFTVNSISSVCKTDIRRAGMWMKVTLSIKSIQCLFFSPFHALWWWISPSFFLHPLSACSLHLKFGMGSAAPAKG